MPTAEDEARAVHQWTRLQILMEDWDDVIDEWLEEHIGEERAEIWGIPDTSANSLADLCRQLSVPGLYGHRPRVDRATGGGQGLVDEGGLLDAAGYWTKMSFVQYLTLGLGDMLTRFHVTRAGRFSVRLVWPHNVFLVGDPEDAGHPVELWELRRRHLLPENRWIYTWEVFDLGRHGPGGEVVVPPSFRIHEAMNGSPRTIAPAAGEFRPGGLGVDLSDRFIRRPDGTFGALVGEDYPWVGDDGQPVFPYGRYQDADTGQLWNTFAKRGAHRGTLNGALYWTYTGHVARDATGSYVILAGLTPSGTDSLKTGLRGQLHGRALQSKLIEAGTMEYHDVREGQTPFVHEVGASENLPALLDFSERYEMRQATRFGLNPSDLSRQSANPSSAAALLVSNEGKREFSAQVQPVFRRADLAAIRIAAIVLAAAGLGTWPQTGYSVQYHEIPKSPQELREIREQLSWELAQGMRSRIGMYQALNRGVGEADALAALQRIAEQERLVEEAIADPTAAAGAGAAQDTALNGAQTDALVKIVQEVASGNLPRDSAIAIVQRAFTVDEPEAQRLLGSAGAGFTIAPPPPPPGALPVDDSEAPDEQPDPDPDIEPDEE